MSGFGSVPFGSTAFGFPEADTQNELSLPVIAPVQFNLNGRVLVVDTDGKAVTCSGVDQRVAIKLGTPKRQIASCPTTGVDADVILLAGKSRVPGVVDTEVRSALSEMLDKREIRINSITTDSRSGTVYWEVDYSNLTLPGAPRRVARPNL